MDRIEQLKLQGNRLFKENEFNLAINSYEDALTAVNYRLSDIQKDHKGYDNSKEIEMKANLLSNLALCYMQRKEYDGSQLYNG